jgi:hypothetical protein
MATPPIVSPQEWEAALQRMRVKEKEQFRVRDALAAERRRMPWVAVEKQYEFVGPDGKANLLAPRHHPRVRLAGTASRHRAGEGPDGLAYAVVHDH